MLKAVPLLGTGPRAAARQGGVLLFLAGGLALLGIANDPQHTERLVVVAGCDVLLGLVTLLPVWRSAAAVAWFGMAAFAILGLSTWSFGGATSGTGPFLVLIYAWAGLHFTRRVLFGYTAPATLAYLVPLVLTGQPPLILGSALVLMPIALAVALLIEAQARHLREDRERLVRIERWRAAMMSTLAHDVRTPLSTVRMVLDEVKIDAPPQVVTMLDAAQRQTARITRLAESLLDIQRIDSEGRLQLDLQVHDANALVKEALSHVRSSDTVVVDVPADRTIVADRQRFEQILVNLMTNAFRYGSSPVVIRVEPDGDVDRLEVRDHGPGIPEELRTRLFDQFAAGNPDGTGLGLWIVYQLTVAHGGRASAEPREPGVAMVVTFPRSVTQQDVTPRGGEPRGLLEEPPR